MALWSTALIDFGLSESQFFALTPRQYHALVKRKERDIEHRELLAGIVASTTANFSMGAPERALSPRDFMPSQWVKELPEPEDVRALQESRITGFLTGIMQLQETLGY